MLPHISPDLEDLFWMAQPGWLSSLEAPLARVIDDRKVPGPIEKISRACLFPSRRG
jgi:hypothetical protein